MPDGQNLRTASRASVHPIREAPHLWMTALAGMPANDLRQFDYLAKRTQKRPADEALA